MQLDTRRPDLRHAVLADDVKRLRIEALEADGVPGAEAVIRLVQVDGAEITKYRLSLAAMTASTNKLSRLASMPGNPIATTTSSCRSPRCC